MDTSIIISYLEELFPDAECELIHKNAYELLIAVTLSAQTTDAAVNKVTPALFAAYPDIDSLASAEYDDVANYIRRIGLYRNKAKNIIEAAKYLRENFNSEVPYKMRELMQLPGCGRKTASVVQSVWFNIPSVPVDTHVERISKRLRIAKPDDSILKVEQKFKRKIKRDQWNKVHHLFIFFGRYVCKAKNPACDTCKLHEQCRYYSDLQKQNNRKK